MRAFRILAVLAALSFMLAPISGVQAGEADPLFVNVTTDDPHRANMALTFLSVVRDIETMRRRKLREALARLIDDVTRLAVDAASDARRWSDV